MSKTVLRLRLVRSGWGLSEWEAAAYDVRHGLTLCFLYLFTVAMALFVGTMWSVERNACDLRQIVAGEPPCQ
jgi:hypothetical protein